MSKLSNFDASLKTHTKNILDFSTGLILGVVVGHVLTLIALVTAN